MHQRNRRTILLQSRPATVIAEPVNSNRSRGGYASGGSGLRPSHDWRDGHPRAAPVPVGSLNVRSRGRRSRAHGTSASLRINRGSPPTPRRCRLDPKALCPRAQEQRPGTAASLWINRGEPSHAARHHQPLPLKQNGGTHSFTSPPHHDSSSRPQIALIRGSPH